MRLIRWLLVSLAVLTIVGIMVAGWLMATESGSRFVARQVNSYVDGVNLTDVEGRLSGGLRIGKLTIDLQEVKVAAQNIAIDVQLRALMREPPRLRIRYLRVDHLVVEPAVASEPVETDQPPWPQSLPAPPLEIALNELDIKTLDVSDTRISAILGAAFWSEDSLRVDRLSAESEALTLKLKAKANIDAPLEIEANGQWRYRGEADELTGQWQASGPLAALQISHSLHGIGEGSFDVSGNIALLRDSVAADIDFSGFDHTGDITLAFSLPTDRWQLSGSARAGGELAKNAVARFSADHTGALNLDAKSDSISTPSWPIDDVHLRVSGTTETLTFKAKSTRFDLSGRALTLADAPRIEVDSGASVDTPMGPWQSEKSFSATATNEGNWQISAHCWRGNGHICLNTTRAGSDGVHSSGELIFSDLSALLPDLIQPTVRITGRWQLTDQPRLSASASIKASGLALKQPGGDLTLPDLLAELSGDQDRWTLDLNGADGNLKVTGKLQGSGLSGDAALDGSANVAVGALEAYADLIPAPAFPAGPAEFTARISGKLESPEINATGSFNGQLRVPDAELAIEGVALQMATNGQSWRLDGSIDDPRLTARARFEGEGLNSEATMNGDFTVESQDTEAIAATVSAISALEGDIRASGSISGSAAAPRFSASGTWQNGHIEALEPAVTFEAIDLGFTADNDGWQATGNARQSSASEPGTFLIEASGNGYSADAQAQVTVDAQRIDLQSKDWQLLANGHFVARAQSRKIDVKGDVDVPQADIHLKSAPPSVPQPSQDVTVLGREVVQQERSMLQGSVKVSLGDDVRLRILGLDARLTGNLTAGLNGGEVKTLQGEIRIPEGILEAAGQTLEIRSGKVQFNGPPDRPYIDVVATRTIENTTPEVNVGVHIVGDVEQLQTRIYSEPPMSETRALSFLVLGRDFNESSETDSQAMLTAAIGFGLKRSAGVVQQLRQNLGLDELQAFSTAQQDIAIVAGKRVSDDLYVRYSYNTLAAIGELIIRYHLGDRWRLEATREAGTAMDLLYEFSTKPE